MPLWLGLEEDEFRTLTWSWQLGGREGYGLWWPESGEVIYHRVSRQTAASHYCYGHSTIISPSQPSIQQGRQFSHFICQKRCVLPSAADPICTFLDVPPNAVHLLNGFIKERTFSVEKASSIIEEGADLIHFWCGFYRRRRDLSRMKIVHFGGREAMGSH